MIKETQAKQFGVMRALSLAVLLSIGSVSYAADSKPCASNNWTTDRGYTNSSVVTYRGHNYEALQAHFAFANTNWIPGSATTMWKDLGACAAPSAPQAAAAAPAPTATASSGGRRAASTTRRSRI